MSLIITTYSYVVLCVRVARMKQWGGDGVPICSYSATVRQKPDSFSNRHRIVRACRLPVLQFDFVNENLTARMSLKDLLCLSVFRLWILKWSARSALRIWGTHIQSVIALDYWRHRPLHRENYKARPGTKHLIGYGSYPGPLIFPTTGSKKWQLLLKRTHGNQQWRLVWLGLFASVCEVVQSVQFLHWISSGMVIVHKIRAWVYTVWNNHHPQNTRQSVTILGIFRHEFSARGSYSTSHPRYHIGRHSYCLFKYLDVS